MSSELTTVISNNLARLRERIGSACDRAGRRVEEVTLVAVTKYADLDWVRALVDLGVADLGESRPQQLVSRASALPADVRWHMIGHLQRNKVDTLLPVVSRIHSVDSVRLIDAIQKESANLNVTTRILLEVNVSGEASKDGFDPDELLSSWKRICLLDAITIEGLMTMAPLSDDPQAARPVFRALRDLRDRLRKDSGGRLPLPDLSMGMSGDFDVAIEEGATLIRIGSSLFEGLAS